MIKQAILNKSRLQHKVQPMKDGRVMVFGRMAVAQARQLAAEGKVEFVSLFCDGVIQGICVVK